MFIFKRNITIRVLVIGLHLFSSKATALTCQEIFNSTSRNLNTQSFAYNNQELNYSYKISKSQKPTVLFIHGLGNNIQSLSKLSQEFSKKGFSILLIDLIGHGKTLESFLENHTKLPFKITMEDQVEIIRALLNSLEVESLHIVGHSYGGGIALKLATQLKAKALSLTLLATLVEKLDNYYLDPFHDFKNFWSEYLKYCLHCAGWDKMWDFWLNPTVEIISYNQFSAYYSNKYPNDLKTAKIHTDAAMAITRGIGTFNALSSFKNINHATPILIINSSSDALSPEALNNQLFSKLKNEGYSVDISTIENSDHYFPTNNPKETADIILGKFQEQN